MYPLSCFCPPRKKTLMKHSNECLHLTPRERTERLPRFHCLLRPLPPASSLCLRFSGAFPSSLCSRFDEDAGRVERLDEDIVGRVAVERLLEPLLVDEVASVGGCLDFIAFSDPCPPHLPSACVSPVPFLLRCASKKEDPHEAQQRMFAFDSQRENRQSTEREI
jgi:hypothetical protein